MHLHARYYDLMNIKDYYMRLSLPDMKKLDKYVDQPEKWLAALAIIKEAMVESGYPSRRSPAKRRSTVPRSTSKSRA